MNLLKSKEMKKMKLQSDQQCKASKEENQERWKCRKLGDRRMRRKRDWDSGMKGRSYTFAQRFETST